MAGVGAGRPTELTEENLGKIRQGILEGKLLKDIANICGISELTIYDWTCKNYQDINTKIEGWKRDRKILLATKNLEDYLEMKTDNVIKVGDKDEIKRDSQLERIKADMTKFTLETLDKENYAKRSELTGKDGGSLIVQTVSYADKDNTNTTQV